MNELSHSFSTLSDMLTYMIVFLGLVMGVWGALRLTGGFAHYPDKPNHKDVPKRSVLDEFSTEENNQETVAAVTVEDTSPSGKTSAIVLVKNSPAE